MNFKKFLIIPLMVIPILTACTNDKDVDSDLNEYKYTEQELQREENFFSVSVQELITKFAVSYGMDFSLVNSDDTNSVYVSDTYWNTTLNVSHSKEVKNIFEINQIFVLNDKLNYMDFTNYFLEDLHFYEYYLNGGSLKAELFRDEGYIPNEEKFIDFLAKTSYEDVSGQTYSLESKDIKYTIDFNLDENSGNLIVNLNIKKNLQDVKIPEVIEVEIE